MHKCHQYFCFDQHWSTFMTYQSLKRFFFFFIKRNNHFIMYIRILPFFPLRNQMLCVTWVFVYLFVFLLVCLLVRLFVHVFLSPFYSERKWQSRPIRFCNGAIKTQNENLFIEKHLIHSHPKISRKIIDLRRWAVWL